VKDFIFTTICLPRRSFNINLEIMKILTLMIAGAAIAAGVTYITRKREDGTSILDDLTNKAPEWMEKGKQYATQTIDQVSDQIRQRNEHKS